MAAKKGAKQHHFDPEYTLWQTMFPEFPGIEKCLEIFDSRDAFPGSWQDVAWMEMTDHASQNLSEYIAVARREVECQGRWSKTVLWTLAQGRFEECRELFTELLVHPLQEFREYGELGIKLLNKPPRKGRKRE